MPLSNRRVIKSRSANVNNEKESSLLIDTILEEDSFDEIAPSVEEVKDDESRKKLKQAYKEKDNLLKDAEDQYQDIIRKAQEEAESIRAEAKQLGYDRGNKEGYQEGFSAGKKEGFNQGKEKSETLKLQAREMIKEAQLDIEHYIKEKKETLLSLSLHMAETIVHEHLSLSENGVLELVHPILHQLDRKEDYISLTVHPSLRETVNHHIPELKQTYPGVRFAFLFDERIDPDGCIVESAHKIIDTQVKKQLEAILKELNEMELDV